MDLRLEEASHAGDLVALHRLLQDDKLLLHKLSATTPSVANNPLHIAALLGHADFVREVVRLNPGLVKDTNVDGLTALHLASAQGHLPVVMELINTSWGYDLCRIHDRDGLMPVHTAAVKGRVPVLRALLEKSPELLEELLSGGETILHFSVKSGCHEALQLLLERMSANQASILLNSKDDMGNTVLHLAAARRQLQTVRMLLTKPEMKVNELNIRGLTALDVLLESPNQNGDLTLATMIMSAGGKRSREVHLQQPVPSIPVVIESCVSHPPTRFYNCLCLILRGMRWLGLTPASQLTDFQEKPSNSSGTLLVVATLIATITFQPIMSPPGGFDSNTGRATHGKNLTKFLVFDIIGLFSSLSVVLLLMCVEHRRRRMLMKFMVWVVWVAAYSTALAFTSAAFIVYPNSLIATIVIYIWYAIFEITVLWVYLRFTIYLFFIVGWWEMHPLYRQTDSNSALIMKRVLVVTVMAAIPVLVMIPGPDIVVDVFFACAISYNRPLKIWDILSGHCWIMVLEFPQVYICFRFTLYLLGIAGYFNRQEIHTHRSRFNLIKKRVLTTILIGVALSLVALQVYYLQVAMWSPDHLSIISITGVYCQNY